MKPVLFLVPTILAFSLCANQAFAQTAELTAQVSPRENSVNVSPLGIAFGSYNINYERLLNGHHGLIVEGAFSRASDSDNSSATGGANVGYRYHWRGRQNSGFVGVMMGYATGSGTGTIDNNGSSKTFDVGVKVFALTANVGKRWAWDNGFNVTFRIGAGYGNYDVSTKSTDPDAQDIVDDIDALLTFLPVAFDGELSAGYAF